MGALESLRWVDGGGQMVMFADTVGGFGKMLTSAKD